MGRVRTGRAARGAVLSIWFAAALAFALAVTPAHATFRGANGKIAHVDNVGGNLEILTVNPDGSGRVNITNDPARDDQPKWSPDGSRIAFMSNRAGNRDIYVMDADGSNQTQLTSDPGHDLSLGFLDTTSPAWSPDGTKIAFTSDRDGDGRFELWVMHADGTDETLLSDSPVWDIGPSWSPDSSQIVFTRADFAGAPGTGTPADVFKVNADGSGLTLLTPEPEHAFDGLPLWSPDGTTISFQYRPADSPANQLWRMNPDGSGKQPIRSLDSLPRGWEPAGQRLLLSPLTTINADGTGTHEWWRNHRLPPDSGRFIVYPSGMWSPDAGYLGGTRQVCYDDDIPCDPQQVFTLDLLTDTLVELARGTAPDWQPVPVNSYPRPKSASPTEIALVPAYEPCTAPNRTHGPPLAFPSCAPPVRTPGELTVGTPDSNGKTAGSTSEVHLQVLAGVPSTPADEADVRLHGTVNDVRVASDLSDYTGALEARVTLRITDKDNTPSPGGPGAATTQDVPYSFPIPCAATANTNVGAECTFDTTAEAFVPGIAKEGRRAIWQLEQLSVHDATGGVFMRQGVFVP